MIAQIDSFPLFPDVVPYLKDGHDQESIAYNQAGSKLLQDVIDPVLYPYIPTYTGKNSPCVIICPGGGYKVVSIVSEGHNIAQWFQERGIAAFVLKYRIPDSRSFDHKERVPLQDVQQAMTHVREHAESYHIDKHNVGVMGFSAGGHLAATAALLYKKSLVVVGAELLRPDFSILIYPVITFTESCVHEGSRQNLIGPSWTPEEELYYSCEKQVDKSTPPTFLLHAKDDKSVPYANSVMYKEALDNQGVANRLVLIDEGGHGFGILPNSSTNYWIEHLKTWLLEMNILE